MRLVLIALSLPLLSCNREPPASPIVSDDTTAADCQPGAEWPCMPLASYGHGTRLPKYFGYYSATAGSGPPLGETVIQLYLGDYAGGLSVESIQRATAQGWKVMVNLTFVFWNDNNLRADGVQRWHQVKDALKPLVDEGKIVAFEAWVDKPFGTLNPPYSEAAIRSLLESIASTVKRDIPAAKFYLLYRAPAVTVGMHAVRIPRNFDWVAADCYGEWFTCEGVGVSWFLNTLRNEALIVNPHMQLVLLGQAIGYCWEAGPDGFNEYSIRERVYQDIMYASNHDDVVAVLVLSAKDLSHVNCRGVHSMPVVYEVWDDFGKRVRRGYW